MTAYPNESNPLPEGWHQTDRSLHVEWTDPRLARVTEAIAAGVNAKRLGMFEAASLLW